jgi:hypothetical protein
VLARPSSGKSLESRHCESDSSLAIAFFYFDFHSRETKQPAVLRALVKQLSVTTPGKTSPKNPDYLVDLFSKKADGNQSPSPDELESTLKSIIGTFKKDVYIIFDALDECPDRTRFLRLIKDIQGWNIYNLHLLATSRYEQDIEKALVDLVSHQVPMDESLVDTDIRIYVSKTLSDDPKFSRYSEEKKEIIKTTLIDGAHGMYVIILPSKRPLPTKQAGFDGLFVSWMHYESADLPMNSSWHSPTYHRLYMGPTIGFS